MKKMNISIAGFLVVALMIVAGCGERISEKEYFEKAEDYQQNEQYQKAAETYLTLYKRYPTGTHGDEALFKAALIQANQLKQFKRAIETHRRILRVYPDSKYAQQSLFMIGFIYANQIKDYEKAKEIYHKFLNQYPNNELVSSVKWELNNLGKDINDIDFIIGGNSDTTNTK